MEGAPALNTVLKRKKRQRPLFVSLYVCVYRSSSFV